MHYSGEVASDNVDLYDQAFVLLALGAAWRALGRPSSLLAEAQQLVGRLRQVLAHPIAGFEESRPRTLPLRSNPHMHLLEAMLAWIEVGVADPFADVAHELVGIVTTRFIDPSTGAVGEYFDGDWSLGAGRLGALREPGHQFEWAFLLSRAGHLLGLELAGFVERLYTFGTVNGVVDGRVIAAVDANGQVIDQSSRLWQQTERLRAALALELSLGDPTRDHVQESLAGFRRFLNTEAPGFWHDRLDECGVPIVEASPASSLYHVMTGLHYFVGKK
jgi:mannose-6-phosphate isomerase